MNGTSIVTEYTNTRNVVQLVDAVRSHGANITVVDVRWSTYYPVDGRFRPETLGPAFQRAGFNYTYRHELGNPFKNMKDMNEMRRMYVKQTTATKSFLDVVSMVSDGNTIVCLICYCKTTDPGKCHRFWLREAIIAALESPPLMDERDFKNHRSS